MPRDGSLSRRDRLLPTGRVRQPEEPGARGSAAGLGRLERGAAAPAARCRPWGTSLAVVALAGSAVGLLRLLVGLWAVRLCRRRGQRGRRPGLIGLLDELRRRDGVSPDGRAARGPRPDHAGHGGLAAAGGVAAGRLAVVGRLPSGARCSRTSWPTSSGAITRPG